MKRTIYFDVSLGKKSLNAGTRSSPHPYQPALTQALNVSEVSAFPSRDSGKSTKLGESIKRLFSMCLACY